MESLTLFQSPVHFINLNSHVVENNGDTIIKKGGIHAYKDE